MPPSIEDLGTLVDLTSTHATLPTQTPLATMGMSTPGMTGGGGPGGHTTDGGGTFTAPSGNTVITPGPGNPGHPGNPGNAGHHVLAPTGHGIHNGSPTHGPEILPTSGSGEPSGGGTLGTNIPLPPGAGGAQLHGGGSLPFTGFPALLAGLIGAIGTSAGVALRRLSRKRKQGV